MDSRLKALGLAFVAAFAMGAVVASAAQATEARFKCGNDPAKECTIKVTQHPSPGIPFLKFKTKAGSLECEEFHATATVKDGTKLTELTLTELKYEECEFGSLAATVSTEPCHYTLLPGNTVAGGGVTGTVGLSQTEGTTCEIKVTAGACIVTFKPQTGLESITYTNVKTGTKEEITAHVALENTKYTTSAGCLGGGAGEGTDGKYEETITMQGFNKANESEQTDLTVPTEARFTCGADATKECTVKVTHDPEAPKGAIKTKAGNLQCANFHATAMMPDGVELSELTLTELEYEECEPFVSVSTGPCHYTLFAGGTVVGGATGIVDVSQAKGTTCEIKIMIFGFCTITIKPQTGLESITYTNVKEETKEEVTAHIVIKQTKYTTSAGCPGGGAGEAENGVYEETITMQGFNKANENEQTDLTVVNA